MNVTKDACVTFG